MAAVWLCVCVCVCVYTVAASVIRAKDPTQRNTISLLFLSVTLSAIAVQIKHTHLFNLFPFLQQQQQTSNVDHRITSCELQQQ